jgi:membrane protease YdiL (CAAX protease family)
MDDLTPPSADPAPDTQRLSLRTAPRGEPPARMAPPGPWQVDWPLWTVPLALIGGLVLAAVGGLVVDLPALALGVKLTPSHTPPGLAVADTFVQDVAFVLAAVYCAQLGGRVVRAWHFGLRPPRRGWASAAGLIVLLLVVFLLLNVVWQALFNPGKEKLLQQLGTDENGVLLVLSAALTCVVAPVSEEFLFRGFIFTALRRWRGALPAALITGVLFGAVHAGSAPVLDLVPLAALGVGLCLLYQRTGSLYPSILAHSLNNSIAFASLEGWVWQAPLLMLGALATIAMLAWTLKRVGVIAPEAAAVPLSP